jgi:hypothetical protein
MVMQSQLSTSTKMSHERAQQAIQDQALLEGRIMNAKSPCVKGFGCRPVSVMAAAPGPASESLQGRNPRDGDRGFRFMGI